MVGSELAPLLKGEHIISPVQSQTGPMPRFEDRTSCRISSPSWICRSLAPIALR